MQQTLENEYKIDDDLLTVPNDKTEYCIVKDGTVDRLVKTRFVFPKSPPTDEYCPDVFFYIENPVVVNDMVVFRGIKYKVTLVECSHSMSGVAIWICGGIRERY